MTDTKKTIELPEDLYKALQELKEVFSQLTWEKIESDADVIWILISGFLDSIQNLQENNQEGNQGIITDAQ